MSDKRRCLAGGGGDQCRTGPIPIAGDQEPGAGLVRDRSRRATAELWTPKHRCSMVPLPCGGDCVAAAGPARTLRRRIARAF